MLELRAVLGSEETAYFGKVGLTLTDGMASNEEISVFISSI